MARYGLAYVDPPWAYRNLKTGGSHTSGSAQKYPTLSYDVLAALPVPTVMAGDSILALWGTTPLGEDPYRLLAAWGFAYKTEVYWHKVGRKGTGYWLRGEVEKLLIGVRGSVPAWRHNMANWIIGDDLLIDLLGDDQTIIHEMKPEGHSRKPFRIRNLLEFVTPGVRRLELFATERAAGWDSYGLALDPVLHDVRDPGFWEALRVEP